MTTTAEHYINYYNRLDGKTVSVETLKKFYDRITAIVEKPEVNGYKADLESMKKRIVQGIFSAGAEKVVKVSCKPINLTKHRTVKPLGAAPAKPRIKKVVVTKQVVKVVKVKEKVKSKKLIEQATRSIAKGAKLTKLQRQQLQDAIKAGAPKVKSKARKKRRTVSPPVKQKAEEKQSSLYGFITSDMAPDKSGDTFTLPGPIGEILGQLQRYKLEIVISGEPHSSKSELGKQIADAFISVGDEVAWIDWEQGGLVSTLTKESINRNVKPENRKHLHVSSEVPKTLGAVKSLARHFRVICLDSGTKLKQFTNEWIDELREQFRQNVWIILMQQNASGKTRGGASAEFDSPVVLKTYRPDETDYKKNYAHVFKNRGNKTGQYYLIADKKIVKHQPGNEPEEVKTPASTETIGIEEKTISI